MCMLLLHTDINECVTDTSECNQICSNTNGSYVCDCYSGYTLLSDGKTCNKDTSKLLHENVINIAQLWKVMKCIFPIVSHLHLPLKCMAFLFMMGCPILKISYKSNWTTLKRTHRSYFSKNIVCTGNTCSQSALMSTTFALLLVYWYFPFGFIFHMQMVLLQLCYWFENFITMRVMANILW